MAGEAAGAPSETSWGTRQLVDCAGSSNCVCDNSLPLLNLSLLHLGAAHSQSCQGQGGGERMPPLILRQGTWVSKLQAVSLVKELRLVSWLSTAES